jgi:5-methylcytosine-specific restriction endonuclease McrA
LSAYKSGAKARERLRQRLKEQQQGLCALCSLPLEENISLDHKIPQSKGGRHATPNLQATHVICNTMKGSR